MAAAPPGGELPAPGELTRPTGASDDEVRLEVPAESTFARVVRIAVSALAVRRGFSVSVVEDLRIAVDESLILLLRSAQPLPTPERPAIGPDSPSLILTLSGGRGEMRVDLRIEPPPTVADADADDALSRFGELIPPRVVVEEVDPSDGHVTLLLTPT